MFTAALGGRSQPSNDAFSARTTITETGVLLLGTLAGATSDPDEPVIAGVSSGQSAWWTWTAPSNGIATVTVAGNGFSPLLAVYQGTDLPGLSLVASNNHMVCYQSAVCGCHWRVRNSTTFHVARGESYHVAVDSAVMTDNSWRQTAAPSPPLLPLPLFPPWEAVSVTNTPPGGPISLRLRLTPAPRNDDFDNRIRISGSRPHVRTSNAGATKETGEPGHLTNSGGSSVWYSWKAPSSGRVTLSINNIPPYSPPTYGSLWTYFGSYGLQDVGVTFGAPPSCGIVIDQNPSPTFFPLFAAYTGSSVDSLVSANCLPLSLPEYPHAVTFDAIKGQTYQIAFDGNMGTTGDIDLYLALTRPAANDAFSRRIRMRGVYVVATGHNAGATSQPGEAALFGDSTGKSVWWSWKAPVNGTVSIALGGSDYRFPVAVFSGSTVSNLALLTSGSGSNLFEAVAGQTYQIAVGDAAGHTGAIKLSLRAPEVELPLVRMSSRGDTALLRYAAAPRQVVLLLRSSDGFNWENVRLALARQDGVTFLVRPPPASSGPPYYRAIVYDRLD